LLEEALLALVLSQDALTLCLVAGLDHLKAGVIRSQLEGWSTTSLEPHTRC
jgi:hypothetical protein